MKKIITLIVFAVVLAILVGVYAIVSSTQKTEESGEEETLIAASLEKEKIAAISYSYAGKDVSLKKSGDAWVWEKNASLPLKQDVVEKMTGALSSVVSTRLVAPVSGGLDEFGFDEPSISVDATLDDGSVYTYKIGDLNPVTMEYYFLRSDGESVWLVDSSALTPFTKTMDDLVEIDKIPSFEPEDLLSCSLASGGKTVELTKDDTGVAGYHAQYSWFVRKDGASPEPADGDLGDQLAEAVASPGTFSFVDYAPDGEKLASYGLDDANAARLSVRYSVYLDESDDETAMSKTVEKDFTLSIGGRSGNGDAVYVRVGDSEMICSLPVSKTDLVLSYLTADLTPRDVFGLDFTYVESLTLTFEGRSYDIRFDEESGLYNVGDKTVTVDVFSSFFTALEALRATSIDPLFEKGEEVFSFTVHTLDADGDPDLPVTLTLFEAGGEYTADFDGRKGLRLSPSDASEIVKKMKALLS